MPRSYPRTYRRRNYRYARRKTSQLRSRYTAKTRVYRRKRIYRRKSTMSKRKILDITATKKKDLLAYFDPSAPSSVDRTIVQSGSATASVFIFCPTAREYINSDDPADRSRATVYWKGYGETGQLLTDTSAPWRWRRIVFEVKGLRIAESYIITSNGYRRAVAPYGDAGTIALLFDGVVGTDYSGIMDAQVNRDRVKVRSDTTRIYRSGNDGNHFHQYRHYFPFEQNFTYDEEESGSDRTSSPWATYANKGMGNVYVLDMFNCVGTGTNTLNFRPTGRCYWHEK